MKAEDYPWKHGLRVKELYSGMEGVVVGIATYAHRNMELQVVRPGFCPDGKPYKPEWWDADQLEVIE